MRKLLLTSTFLLILSVSFFADEGGDTPGGNKGCPNGQTLCRVVVPAEPETGTIIISVRDILIDIFF